MGACGVFSTLLIQSLGQISILLGFQAKISMSLAGTSVCLPPLVKHCYSILLQGSWDNKLAAKRIFAWCQVTSTHTFPMSMNLDVEPEQTSAQIWSLIWAVIGFEEFDTGCRAGVTYKFQELFSFILYGVIIWRGSWRCWELNQLFTRIFLGYFHIHIYYYWIVWLKFGTWGF